MGYKNTLKVKNYFIALACLFIFIWIGLLQADPINPEDYVYERKEVQLKPIEIVEKKFIYENELIEIEADISDFYRMIKTDIAPYNEKYAKILEDKIKSMDVDKYRLSLFNNDEKEGMKGILSMLVEEGTVVIKEKCHNEKVAKIIIEYYKYNPAPLWGERGRIFKLMSGEIFYEQLDESY